MDAVNHHGMDYTTPTPTPFTLSDFDHVIFEQLRISPGAPVHSVPETPSSGRRRGGEGNPHNTKEESMAVVRSWMSVVNDPVVGTDQTDAGSWARIVDVYNGEKNPPDAKERNDDRLQKKWGQIRSVVRKFVGIYHNNLRQPASGRSQSDIRELSIRMYNQDSPRFTYWEEYELLQTCPKFRELEEEAESKAVDGLPKRTRLRVAENYSSNGSGSTGSTSTKRSRRNPPSYTPAADTGPFAPARPYGVPMQDEHASRMIRQWHLAEAIEKYSNMTDPLAKTMLLSLIQQMMADLGLPGLPRGQFRRRRVERGWRRRRQRQRQPGGVSPRCVF